MPDTNASSKSSLPAPLAVNPRIEPGEVTSPFVAEQLLIDFLTELGDRLTAERALVVSPGRAQAAEFISQNLYGDPQAVSEQPSELNKESGIDCWYIDLYAASLARHYLRQTVDVYCCPDIPDVEYDLAVFATTKKNEAELTRDVLSQMHQRLKMGGRMIVSVDHPKDIWLQQQLQPMFDKVTRVPAKEGVVYTARKTSSLKKVKDFSCEFPFRDEEGQMLKAFTRPGVFSHRRLDPGARQLLRAADIEASDRVLDLGCGAGVLAISAAFRTSAEVFAVDANARAIQCTGKVIELNGVSNVTAILNADGHLELDGTIDVVMANPPYFGGDAISRHFVDSSIVALRPGGALLVVTKKPRWYSEYFDGRLDDIVIFESGKYFVACGRKPGLA